MGFLKRLVGVAAPIVGGILGGPAGASIGGAVGSFLGGEDQRESSAQATDLAYARNAEQAQLQRNWASQEASTARQFNELQAQKQMDFQERLANSAHQREVADLRAAGLNPILSGTGGMGSATPVGASAHASAPSGSAASAPAQAMLDIVTPALSTAMNLSMAQAEIAKKEADVKNVESETRFRDTSGVAESDARIATMVIEQGLKSEQASLTRAQIDKVQPEIAEILARAKSHVAAASREYAQVRNLDESTRERRVAADADEWAAKYGIPEMKRSLEVVGMATESAKDLAQAFWSAIKPKIVFGSKK